jgi:phenylacetate-coenzyme A ligase PaaK-like adenylate-forming protein
MGARYIVGYPSGIASLARRAEEMRLDFPQLTHAILTSETVENTDIKLIERAFQVTALVEYGAIELGAIAGSCNDHGGWPLKVHWWSHLMQLDEADSALISTLEPRIFPLINYAVGDMIVPERVTPGGSVFTIQQVLGRTRDTVTIETRDGEIKTVLARSLCILVRDLPKVTSVQITQRQKGRVELLVVAPGANQKELISKMALAFSRNRKDFRPGSVTVAFIEQHVASARGKRGVFVDKISVPEHFETFSVIPK